MLKCTSSIKEKVISETQEKVDKVTKQFSRGLITEEERHNTVVDLWNKAVDTVSDDASEILEEQLMGDNTTDEVEAVDVETEEVAEEEE